MDLAERMKQAQARRQREFDDQARLRKQRALREEAQQNAALAVLEGRTPSLKNLDDVTIVHVVDPHDEAQFHDGKLAKAPPARAKLVTLRDDPVGRMHRRGQLGEGADSDVRLKAARHVQTLYEASELGAVRGIDPVKDKVDGGGACEPDTDARMAAQRQIIRIEAELGDVGAELVRLVLWAKMTISQVAALEGIPSQREIDYLARRFRETLDTCAVVLGYKPARGAHGPRRARDQWDELAEIAANPREYDHVHRQKHGS
jgi:hypothetical protein